MINKLDIPTRTISVSDSDSEIDLNFEPLVTLPKVELVTNEENEEELVKLRAKLFRFDTTDHDFPEWKERGTGEVKLLKHKENKAVRVVMRRDKTLKICANHFITPWMDLKPSAGSNRAWVWTVAADFADEQPKAECLAIRFASPEIAAQWKDKFEEAKHIIKTECALYKDDYVTKKDTCSETSSSDDEEEEDSDKHEELIVEKTDSDQKIVIDKLAELNVTK